MREKEERDSHWLHYNYYYCRGLDGITATVTVLGLGILGLV